jgi:4-amino-4-deoxy-L-arabinose transferase-like glycosyltransferase
MASRGQLGSLDGLVLPEQVMPNVVGRATMPSQFLVGRGMVAVSSVLTVLLVYWITRRAYNRRAAVLAALLLCFSPTHVRNSHFIAPDVPMILFLAASFAFTYEVWHHGRRRDCVLAGFLAGLAISTKYNAYPILVPLLVATMMRPNQSRSIGANLALALGSCLCGFLITTPYALLDLPAFLNGLAFELRHYATLGDPGTEYQNALLWYTGYLLRNEGVLPLLAALEALRGALTRSRKVLLMLSFPATYLVLLASSVVKNDRTILTIVPFLAMLAGGLLDRLIEWVRVRLAILRRYTTLGYVATLLVALSALLWPALRAVEIDIRFTQEDVRTQVTEWLEKELPASRIAGEYYSPLLVSSKHEFHWLDRAIDEPIAWYEESVDYVVFVENRYGGFYLDPSRYSAETSAYDRMFEQFMPVKEFQGGALGNPCAAKVYKVTP